MKKLALLTLILVFFTACDCNEKPAEKVAVLAEKEQINAVLDTWHNSASEANFENYFNAMSSESTFVGTDAAEVWNVQQFKDFSKPYFDKGAAWSFKAIERNVYLNTDGKIAWFDELLATWMGICRGSGVLKKVENEWKIEHYVLSVTVPNDNIQQVIAVNKEKDSLFLAKFK
jgi:hypothetical protein